jgi:hypothetical protein
MLPEQKAARRRQKAPREIDEIQLAKNHVLRRIDGLWYEFKTRYENLGRDYWTGQEIIAPRTTKHSLSRAELRRYGLTNDPDAKQSLKRGVGSGK